MISKYLISKGIIDQIVPTVNDEELLNNYHQFYNLNLTNFGTISYYCRNVFTSFELGKLVGICKKLPKERGLVSNTSELEKYRRSSISWVNINSQTEWIYQKLTDCITEVNSIHYEYDLTRIEKLQFTHYDGKSKEFYDKHNDSVEGIMVDTRKLTFVLQLSSPEDYTGGELLLHTSKSPEIVPKEKGLITFFPSHTLHECTPVTSGDRYTLVGWIHGPKFK